MRLAPHNTNSLLILLCQCRVLYLMNLDYRKGEINFEDLNSEKEYDPDTAFYQSQLANMLTVTRLAKHRKDDNISVNAV